MSVEVKPRWKVSEDFLECMSVDLSPLHRINAIIGCRYSCIDMFEFVADTESAECPYQGDDLSSIQGLGWVYALFDGEPGTSADVLYVGMTRGRLALRMVQHTRGTDVCWRRAERLGVTPDWVAAWHVGDAAARLEKATILALQPILNTKDVS